MSKSETWVILYWFVLPIFKYPHQIFKYPDHIQISAHIQISPSDTHLPQKRWYSSSTAKKSSHFNGRMNIMRCQWNGHYHLFAVSVLLKGIEPSPLLRKKWNIVIQCDMCKWHLRPRKLCILQVVLALMHKNYGWYEKKSSLT